MGTALERVVPQPLIGAVTIALALIMVTVGWLASSPASTSSSSVLVALYLVVTVVLSRQLPIHVRYNTKLYVDSVPLFLIAVLLPPPLAATAAGLGILAAELAVRSRTGLYFADIATITGSWMAVVFAGSLAAHVPVPNRALEVLVLLAAAIVLLLGHIVTSPLLFSPMNGEQPLRVIVNIAQEAGPAEATQYLVGVLGALAAMQQVLALALLPLPTILVYLAFKSAKEMHDGTRQLLESLADTVDLRDPYTGGHSRRVTDYTAGILREMGRTGPEVDMVVVAARVHDVGKIGVPDSILLKPESLTPDEQRVMEAHTEHGADLLKRYADFAAGVEIVRHHHERWDGEGYPHRLRGNAIPFGARVVAVADSFDAMTTDRPYRRGLSAARAAEILREGAGQWWDPDVVDAFLRSIAERLEQQHAPHLRVVRDSPHEGGAVTA